MPPYQSLLGTQEIKLKYVQENESGAAPFYKEGAIKARHVQLWQKWNLREESRQLQLVGVHVISDKRLFTMLSLIDMEHESCQ